MPTTGTVLAKDLAIYVDGVKITCQTNAEFSMSRETYQTTCKDSGAFAENRTGTLSWTMSGEGLLAFDAVMGYKQLWDAMIAETLISVSLDTGVAGDFAEEGDGYITSLSKSSQGNDAGVTFSFEITGTGEPTYTS